MLMFTVFLRKGKKKILYIKCQCKSLLILKHCATKFLCGASIKFFFPTSQVNNRQVKVPAGSFFFLGGGGGDEIHFGLLLLHVYYFLDHKLQASFLKALKSKNLCMI